MKIGVERIIFGYSIVVEINEHCQNLKSIPLKCSIETKGDSVVSWTRPIRNAKDRLEFKQLTNDLERRGIVEPSESLWLKSVVLNRKKNDKLRFCVDLRRANELVEKDGYSIPRIQDLISTLRGQKYYTLIGST